MNIDELNRRIDDTYEVERSELIRLGRALLGGLPGRVHRHRVLAIRLDRDALLAAQRIARGRQALSR